MGILYYPDSFIKKTKSPVDALQPKPYQVDSGSADLSEGWSYVFSQPSDCEILEVQLTINNSAAKTYTISKVTGRRVIEGANDVLWFKTDGVNPQKIVLSPGFYNGDELAAELKSQLDSNEQLDGAGLTPFTVNYDPNAGKFSVSPDSGTLEYFNTNVTVPIFHRHSTAGPLIGFTVDMPASNELTSNVEVFGLLSDIPLITEADSSDQSIVSTDVWSLPIDQAIGISVSAVSATAYYNIVYRVL